MWLWFVFVVVVFGFGSYYVVCVLFFVLFVLFVNNNVILVSDIDVGVSESFDVSVMSGMVDDSVVLSVESDDVVMLIVVLMDDVVVMDDDVSVMSVEDVVSVCVVGFEFGFDLSVFFDGLMIIEGCGLFVVDGFGCIIVGMWDFGDFFLCVEFLFG